MSRFYTGNPLGSGSPLDLDDNAKNFDLAAISPEDTFLDRFKQTRLTYAGMESEFQSAQESRSYRFNNFIASSGYQFVGDYGPGIEITEYNQLIRDSNGEFWRVSGQVDLPYVTTGAGAPEDDALVPVGDAVLRKDLADPDKGAALVRFSSELGNYPEGTVGEVLQHNPLASDVTVKIPTDFSSLQDALNYCSRKRGAEGHSITVLIESGYVIEQGFRLDDVDVGHVILKSEDAIVPVSADFQHVSTSDLPAGVARSSFYSFVAVRSVMPRWDILVDHSAAPSAGGYCLFWSDGYIYNYKGIQGVDFTEPDDPTVSGIGVRVAGKSELAAPYAVSRECGIGFAVTQGSEADIQFTDATGCRRTGIDVSRNASAYALGSRVDGAGGEGFYVRRSRLIAEAASIKNCHIGIRAAAMSHVSAINSVLDGSNILVTRESFAVVDITGATRNGVSAASDLSRINPPTLNNLDQVGATTTKDAPSSNAPTLSSAFVAQFSGGGQVTAGPGAWTAVNSASSARIIFGGALYGSNIGYRIVADGVTLLSTIANAVGQDSSGDGFTVLPIPAFVCSTGYTIEVYNRGTSPTTVGWNVTRRI